jgi:integrase
MAQRRLPPGIVEHGAGYEAWVWSKQDGKKIRKQFSGMGALSAAKNWRADALKPVREGRLRAGDSRVTVKAWLEKWLDEKAPQDASPRVVDLYRSNLETHVMPELGHLRLTNLRRSDCNELVGVLFRKGLAKNTIKNVLTPLRLALGHAVDEEKIAGNPAAGLKIPKEAPTRTLHVPDLDEVGRIIETCDDDGREAIVLDASLGLRKSEILALRWMDVDFIRNTVHVRQKNINGRIEPGSKTEAGVRKVPLYATAKKTLEARAKRKGLQPRWLDTDERLIFPNSHGGPVHPRNWIRDVWEPARKDAGLEDVRFHDLRHFSVTQLRELGMASKLRTVTVGHTNTKTTEGYDDVKPEHIEAAATAYDPLGRSG